MKESRVITLFVFCNILDEMYVRIAILLKYNVLYLVDVFITYSVSSIDVF